MGSEVMTTFAIISLTAFILAAGVDFYFTKRTAIDRRKQGFKELNPVLNLLFKHFHPTMVLLATKVVLSTMTFFFLSQHPGVLSYTITWLFVAAQMYAGLHNRGLVR